MPDVPDLLSHEASSSIPLMQGDEFKALCCDIRKRGLREPIWLYDGKIIDGRNRYRACKAVGVEPTLRCWNGDSDPADLMASLNNNWRHLSAPRRCQIAIQLIPWYEATAEGKTSPKSKSPRTKWLGRAFYKATAAVGMSETTVRQYQAILKNEMPELLHLVDSGKLSIAYAWCLISDFCIRGGPAGREKVLQTIRAGGGPAAKDLARTVRKSNGSPNRSPSASDKGAKPPKLAKLDEPSVPEPGVGANPLVPDGEPTLEAADLPPTRKTSGVHPEPVGIWREILKFVDITGKPGFIETIRKLSVPEVADELIRTCQRIIDAATLTIEALEETSAKRNSTPNRGRDGRPARTIRQSEAHQGRHNLDLAPDTQGALDSLTQDWPQSLKAAIASLLRMIGTCTTRCARQIEGTVEQYRLEEIAEPETPELGG